MSNRSNTQRAARLLQDLTGWSYTECLRLSREMTADAIEMTAQMRARPISKEHPKYAAWRKRATRPTRPDAGD